MDFRHRIAPLPLIDVLPTTTIPRRFPVSVVSVSNANPGTNDYLTTISTQDLIDRVSRWPLTSRKHKRKPSSGSCTSSSMGSSTPAGAERSRTRNRRSPAGCARPAPPNNGSKEQNRQNLKRSKAREERGTTEKDRSEDGS